MDPSEAGPVLAALTQRGLLLSAILCTHHHHDHVGGNIELLERFPGIPVYGHKGDQSGKRIPGQTHGLDDMSRSRSSASTPRRCSSPATPWARSPTTSPRATWSSPATRCSVLAAGACSRAPRP